MQTGFTFKGIHSSKMGISAATKVRPLIPETRQCEFTLPLSDGKVDFSAANIYGRPFYENRLFTINMHITAKDIFALQKKLSSLASWLIGSGDLIFDDMPSVIWRAKVISGLDYAPEKRGKSALLSVNFEVEPFSVGNINTLEGASLGTAVCVGARLPLEIKQAMTFDFTGTTSLEIMNIGTAPVKPVFTITAAKALPAVTIRIGTNSISCAGLGDNGVIDCGKYNIYGNGMEMSSLIVMGDFPELLPGVNTVGVEMSQDGEYSMEVLYIPKFIYNSDYELIDWGDTNADAI